MNAHKAPHKAHRRLLLAATALLFSSAAGAQTLDLKTAIQAALDSHPEINQAIQNKEAIEFEREQAQGQLRPRISIEGSAGVRKLSNTTRRSLGIADQTLYPVEGAINGDQILFDSGARKAEIKRQASRTDGAALRVEERSQFVALNVAHQYLEYMLQQRIVAASEDNAAFHQKLVSDMGEGVQKGSISIADLQQAQERLAASLVRQTEAEQDMQKAALAFQTLTGLPIRDVVMPAAITSALPPTVEDAVAMARDNSPRVREAKADIDAAHYVVDAARADLGPTVSLNASGRIGDDIDGFRGKTTDVQGRLVMRWNIFDGGINRAKVQEMTRRASEARFVLSQYQREAEQDVRSAWISWKSETLLTESLAQQSKVSDDLLLSYREQFNVGRRSLLDVLDSQNTRYNVQTRLEAARFAQIYAQYRILASTSNLLSTLAVTPSSASIPYARERFNVPETPAAEVMRRRHAD